MTQNKMTASVLEHRNGQKERENNTKTRTTMVHQIADFINYLAGVVGLCLIVSFSVPPLIGWGDWQAGPLLAGALLVAQAALREVPECTD